VEVPQDKRLTLVVELVELVVVEQEQINLKVDVMVEQEQLIPAVVAVEVENVILLQV
jgi:hypothetical protein